MYATPGAGMSRNGEIMRWTLPAEIPKKCQIRLFAYVCEKALVFFWSTIFDFDFPIFSEFWLFSLECDLPDQMLYFLWRQC